MDLKTEKFPALFPVSMEFDRGDEFAPDCVHSHPVLAFVQSPSSNAKKAAIAAFFA
jgi:hypothetical protein